MTHDSRDAPDPRSILAAADPRAHHERHGLDGVDRGHGGGGRRDPRFLVGDGNDDLGGWRGGLFDLRYFVERDAIDDNRTRGRSAS